jgi:hypothetical protein
VRRAQRTGTKELLDTHATPPRLCYAAAVAASSLAAT